MASRAIYGVCARQVGWGPALKVERSHACKTLTWPASTGWISYAAICMAETTMNCSSPARCARENYCRAPSKAYLSRRSGPSQNNPSWSCAMKMAASSCSQLADGIPFEKAVLSVKLEPSVSFKAAGRRRFDPPFPSWSLELPQAAFHSAGPARLRGGRDREYPTAADARPPAVRAEPHSGNPQREFLRGRLA